MADGSTTQPITISARNCDAMTGMSWPWVKRFAAAHGVPVYRVGERKQLVPAAPLLAAIAQHAATQRPQRELTPEQERARMLDELDLEEAP